MLTRVSETIPKPPLAEAQTAVGKQGIHSVERGYLFHCQNSMKNCFAREISLKPGNWLLSYALDCQILSKSVHPQRRYDVYIDF